MTARYFFARLGLAIAFVFTSSSVSFFLVRWAPGDYVSQSLGTTASSQEAEQMRARLGLDRSASQQYLDWLSRAIRLDFGRSFVDGRSVRESVASRAGNTALLAVAALFLATIVGLGLGTLTGRRPDSAFAAMVSRVSLAVLSLPPLLTSLLLIFVAANTRWLPTGGMRSVSVRSDVGDLVWHMVIPVLALALPLAAVFERLHSKSIEQTLRAPFILASRARGASERRLLWVSAMKPSLRATASFYGVGATALFSGSFAVEIVTAWPGLARLMVDALRSRDVYLVAGCATAGSLVLAVTMLGADVALGAVDPRAVEG